jgi:hypothetical protein
MGAPAGSSSARPGNSGEVFHRRGACPADRIDRNPKADVLPALDVVVRLILMPGRGLARSGLLRKHVIVVETRRRALHQPARCCGERRVKNKAPIVGILAPVAKVLDEAAGIIRAARDFGARTGHGQIQLDAGAQLLDFIGTK